MRSDQHTINGLLAYQLGIAQSASLLSVTTPAVSVTLSDTKYPTSDILAGFPNIYPATPTTHFDKVDEAAADDASTYIKTGNSTTIVYDRYGKPSYTLPAGQKVAMVSVICRGMTEKYGTNKESTFWLGVYVGTTYYLSGGKKTNFAWTTYTENFSLNPATGLEWTQTDINNMQIAVAGQSYLSVEPAYYYAYVTQVHVKIYTYTDATVYYSTSVWKRNSGGTETAIETNIASYSTLISALRLAEGLKSATGIIDPQVSMTSTDSIVVRVYQKVGAGAWNLVREFTTEQLGAQSLDAVTWTIYYYLSTSVDTSYVYTVFYHGTSVYNSRIENFTWTAGAMSIPVAMHHYSQMTRIHRG